MLSHRFALKGTELSLSALLTVLGDFEVLFNFIFFGRCGNVIYRKAEVKYLIATVTLPRSFLSVLFLEVLP